MTYWITDVTRAVVLEAGFTAFWGGPDAPEVKDELICNLYRESFVRTATLERAEGHLEQYVKAHAARVADLEGQAAEEQREAEHHEANEPEDPDVSF